MAAAEPAGAAQPRGDNSGLAGVIAQREAYRKRRFDRLDSRVVSLEQAQELGGAGTSGLRDSFERSEQARRAAANVAAEKAASLEIRLDQLSQSFDSRVADAIEGQLAARGATADPALAEKSEADRIASANSLASVNGRIERLESRVDERALSDHSEMLEAISGLRARLEKVEAAAGNVNGASVALSDSDAAERHAAVLKVLDERVGAVKSVLWDRVAVLQAEVEEMRSALLSGS